MIRGASGCKILLLYNCFTWRRLHRFGLVAPAWLEIAAFGDVSTCCRFWSIDSYARFS